MKYPHLIKERYSINKIYSGVYYIQGNTMFDMQLIVSKELESSQNIWLHSLQNNISQEVYQQLLLSVSGLDFKEKEIYGDAVLEVVSKANISNIKKWKEESEMCATLEKIMAPELDAREIKGKISAYAEMGLSVEEIASKVSLSIEAIEEILAKK